MKLAGSRHCDKLRGRFPSSRRVPAIKHATRNQDFPSSGLLNLNRAESGLVSNYNFEEFGGHRSGCTCWRAPPFALCLVGWAVAKVCACAPTPGNCEQTQVPGLGLRGKTSRSPHWPLVHRDDVYVLESWSQSREGGPGARSESAGPLDTSRGSARRLRRDSSQPPAFRPSAHDRVSLNLARHPADTTVSKASCTRQTSRVRSERWASTHKSGFCRLRRDSRPPPSALRPRSTSRPISRLQPQPRSPVHMHGSYDSKGFYVSEGRVVRPFSLSSAPLI